MRTERLRKSDKHDKVWENRGRFLKAIQMKTTRSKKRQPYPTAPPCHKRRSAWLLWVGVFLFFYCSALVERFWISPPPAPSPRHTSSAREMGVGPMSVPFQPRPPSAFEPHLARMRTLTRDELPRPPLPVDQTLTYGREPTVSALAELFDGGN